MKITSLVLLMLAAIASAAKQPQSLPSSIPVCYMKQKDYENCLARAIETALQVLANGLPSLGVLPIDPLQVTQMSLVQGSGPVMVDLDFQNVSLIGFKDSKFTKVSNELLSGGTKIFGEMQLPKLSILSKYKINGRILLLPIHGEGQANITIINLKSAYTIENEIIKKKNGQEYIKVKAFRMKLKPSGKSYLNFENLFNGDKRLSDQMNMILNENSNDIVSEMSPAIEETFGEICKAIANRLFLNVPYKHIFPMEKEEMAQTEE